MELSFEDIIKTIEVFNKSDINDLRLETGDVVLRLKSGTEYLAKAGAVKPDKASAESIMESAMASQSTIIKNTEVIESESESKPGKMIKAPIAGVFYRTSEPDAAPYVSVGDKVHKGDVMGLLEAMKTMNEIKAPEDGVVLEILAENEKFTEYGAPVFRIGEPGV